MANPPDFHPPDTANYTTTTTKYGTQDLTNGPSTHNPRTHTPNTKISTKQY